MHTKFNKLENYDVFSPSMKDDEVYIRVPSVFKDRGYGSYDYTALNALCVVHPKIEKVGTMVNIDGGTCVVLKTLTHSDKHIPFPELPNNQGFYWEDCCEDDVLKVKINSNTYFTPHDGAIFDYKDNDRYVMPKEYR